MRCVRDGLLMATLATLAAGGVGGCDREEPETLPPLVSTPLVPPSSLTEAPPEKSPLRILARGSGPMRIAGSNGEGVVLFGKRGLVVRDGKLAEDPRLYRGLEHPEWQDVTLVGTSADLVALAGKRDPGALQKGDLMMYQEDKGIDASRTVYRSYQKGAWVRVNAVREGERFGGLGRFQGRLVSAIQMPEGTDYRFALIAGKPGIALPSPGAVDQPKEEPSAAGPSVATAEPGATGSAPAAVDSASSTPPGSAPPGTMPPATSAATPADAAAATPATKDPVGEAKGDEESSSRGEPDPNLPQPTNEDCATRLVPRAFDGLESGEAMVVGRVCPGDGPWWVEHWQAGKRKAQFEKLPASPDGERVALAMTVAGEAYVADLGGSLLLQRQGDAWAKIEAPGNGSIDYLGASPKGRVWLVRGGKVFHRLGASTWSELVLPFAKKALAVLPADDEVTFVVATNELLGPPDAAPDAIIEIGKGATLLCQEPYVIVRRAVSRGKRYPDDVDKVKQAGVSDVELVFGHRSMFGEDSLQAKVADMQRARKLAKALGGADIACGAPRTMQKVP